MNNKIILLMSLMVLVGIVGFVSAKFITTSQDGYNHDVEVEVVKGWNLIIASPIIGVYEGDDYADSTITSDSEITRDNVKAVYIYLREKKKYTTMYPNAQEYMNYVRDLPDDPSYKSYIMFSSVWVYSSKAGTLKYSRVNVPKYNQVALKNGWNFLTITPEMAGKSLNDIKGSCNIEKVYLWDAQNQQWGTIFNLLDDKNILQKEGNDGEGFIIKVSDYCVLGDASGGAPPELP